MSPFQIHRDTTVPSSGKPYVVVLLKDHAWTHINNVGREMPWPMPAMEFPTRSGARNYIKTRLAGKGWRIVRVPSSGTGANE
jgi:hypothetical protein